MWRTKRRLDVTRIPIKEPIARVPIASQDKIGSQATQAGKCNAIIVQSRRKDRPRPRNAKPKKKASAATMWRTYPLRSSVPLLQNQDLYQLSIRGPRCIYGYRVQRDRAHG